MKAYITLKCLGYHLQVNEKKAQHRFNLQLECKEQNNEDDSGCCHDKDAHHFMILLLVSVSLL